MMRFSKGLIGVGMLILAFTAVLLSACGDSSDGGVAPSEGQDEPDAVVGISSGEGQGGEEVAVKWIEAAIASDREAAATLWSITGENLYFGEAWEESVTSLAGCEKGNIKEAVLEDVRSGIQGVVGTAIVILDPPCGRNPSSGDPLGEVRFQMERPGSYWFVQGYYPWP